MALKIRLRQQGRTGHRQYRLVVTDTRARRDGRYVEMLGWYDPVQKDDEKTLLIKTDRVQHWVEHGAQPTEKAAALIQRTAPEILRKQSDRQIAQRAKAQQKRRARRKKASAAK